MKLDHYLKLDLNLNNPTIVLREHFKVANNM